MQHPMDAMDSKAFVVIKIHQIVNETSSNSSPSNPATDHSKHKCSANEITEQIPLAANPSILLHVLSSYELEPNDLAALEVTCKFFRSPANFEQDAALSLPELAEHLANPDESRKADVWTPKLATSIAALNEKVVQISATNTRDWIDKDFCYLHTLVLTESGRLYSFGAGRKGQLGVKLALGKKRRSTPDRVDIDLA